MLRLRRYDGSLPGGYPYVQPQTGMKFSPNAGWREQIRTIRKHRLANKLPRTELTEIADDLEAYQCQRLPGMCMDLTANPAQINALAARGTRSGGCGHCGGRRKK